jgi:hypothetical protein
VLWIGVFAQQGTPRDIVAAEPMVLTPAEFDRFIRAEIESNAAIAKAAGIQPN